MHAYIFKCVCVRVYSTTKLIYCIFTSPSGPSHSIIFSEIQSPLVGQRHWPSKVASAPDTKSKMSLPLNNLCLVMATFAGAK